MPPAFPHNSLVLFLFLKWESGKFNNMSNQVLHLNFSEINPPKAMVNNVRTLSNPVLDMYLIHGFRAGGMSYKNVKMNKLKYSSSFLPSFSANES